VGVPGTRQCQLAQVQGIGASTAKG